MPALNPPAPTSGAAASRASPPKRELFDVSFVAGDIVADLGDEDDEGDEGGGASPDGARRGAAAARARHPLDWSDGDIVFANSTCFDGEAGALIPPPFVFRSSSRARPGGRRTRGGWAGGVTKKVRALLACCCELFAALTRRGERLRAGALLITFTTALQARARAAFCVCVFTHAPVSSARCRDHTQRGRSVG